MCKDIINLKDYPLDAKDAAERVRKLGRKLNQEIEKAKQLLNVDTKIILDSTGKYIERFEVTKRY